MAKKAQEISVWFFIGALLAFYGLVITAYGIYAWNSPSNVVMAEYHADFWWGLLLLIIGSVYTVKFKPTKAS